MIKKFEKYNEGIKHLLTGPSEKEILDDMIDKYNYEDMLYLSADIAFLPGIKYVVENYPLINKYHLEDCIIEIVEL